MLKQTFKRGDKVIFRASKSSDHPGPRAEKISPAQKGDDYHYFVDKFWIVADILDDRTVVLKTRRGKVHQIACDHPQLRKANLWERIRFQARFPAIDGDAGD